MTAENKEYTAPEQGFDVAPAENEAALQAVTDSDDTAVAPALPEESASEQTGDALPALDDMTDDSGAAEAAEDELPSEAAPEEPALETDEQPKFDWTADDAEGFRPDDVSEDGSPHGPLDLFDDESEGKDDQKDGDSDEEPSEEKNVPTFAAFHSPSVDAEEEEEDDEEEEDEEEDAPMTLMGHLNELRRRLFRIVIIVILGFVAFYGVAEPLYGFLSAPLKVQLPAGSKLIYTSPAGAFFTYMKVALVASLFGTSPFSFYQIWAFIAPGLYKEEKRAVLPLAFFSSVFFIAGASFCFFMVFPIAFKFFMGFATETIVPMISVEEYLGFALKLLIAFGVVFEMPLFAFFLSRFGLLTPAFMRRQRRYAILFIFIVAAILTPPDVFSQCLMAIPMLLLYEVSIYVSAAAYKKKDEKKADAEDEPTEETA